MDAATRQAEALWRPVDSWSILKSQVLKCTRAIPAMSRAEAGGLQYSSLQYRTTLS